MMIIERKRKRKESAQKGGKGVVVSFGFLRFYIRDFVSLQSTETRGGRFEGGGERTVRRIVVRRDGMEGYAGMCRTIVRSMAPLRGVPYYLEKAP